MTHPCVSKLNIIDSNNGLSPGWRHAIIWTNVGNMLVGNLVTNLSEILSEIHTFSFKIMHLEISSAKWQPFCHSLTVLTHLRSGYHMIMVPYIMMSISLINAQFALWDNGEVIFALHTVSYNAPLTKTHWKTCYINSTYESSCMIQCVKTHTNCFFIYPCTCKCVHNSLNSWNCVNLKIYNFLESVNDSKPCWGVNYWLYNWFFFITRPYWIFQYSLVGLTYMIFEKRVYFCKVTLLVAGL